MKDRLVILFPEGNLPYSPTTLNLIKYCSRHFEVYVIGREYSSAIDTGISFSFVPVGAPKGPLFRFNYLKHLVTRTKNYFFSAPNKDQVPFYDKFLFAAFRRKIREIKPSRVIAVDLFALDICRRMDLQCVFLSLEIPAKSPYLDAVKYEGIEKVIIQSQSRYEYFFGNTNRRPAYFILPNAPVFKQPLKRTAASKHLTYNGYIWSAFGPQFCLGFISRYPEYVLHIKGVAHEERLIPVFFPYLLNAPNLDLDPRYLKQDELAAYLSNFSIGFCFFNFEHPFVRENDFNYRTGPAGKLYTYLSVGLPVICSKIEGFQFVSEEGAGILIDDYSPESIKTAVETILSNYSFYSDNALKVAEKNCFETNIQPVLDYLTSKN